MEFKTREGRNDSLRLELKEYMKKEKEKKRKKTTGQPLLALRQHAPEADT